MFRRFSLIALFGLLLAACTAEPDYSSIAPQDQVAYSAQFLEQIRAGAVDGALEQISETGRESARPIIENAAQNFPKENVKIVRVIGYRALPQQPGVQNPPVANLDLRYDFANNDALVATILLSSDGQRYFVSFLNFTPLSASLIEEHSFPGTGKNIAYWIYLFVAFVIVAFILYTLYLCIRGPGPRWRWRWLWLLAITLAIMRFNLIWTTGQLIPTIGFVPFGFWFSKNGAYAPYVFTVGFPLGAILFWAFRSRWANQPKPAVAAPVQPVVEAKKDETPSV